MSKETVLRATPRFTASTPQPSRRADSLIRTTPHAGMRPSDYAERQRSVAENLERTIEQCEETIASLRARENELLAQKREAQTRLDWREVARLLAEVANLKTAHQVAKLSQRIVDAGREANRLRSAARVAAA